ncbi:TPA: type I restriction-modification system subunit M [Vibrio diabolicus]|uniref:type I restriction-modification system subunit M n=1 Tax=Vibrio diabolicus TaxID=50719 RepID=UPI0021512DC4|nr:type I restriction-modification system subunit M [Vibrio diabolicus]EGQ8097223.1 N-6 DNA methylase [Vibrio parahaemolyticus]MBR9873307.1 N-6 DNA methylase [Vibrionaceae bacterium]EGQ8450767.1 N-6 DNA methylase [Vibrio parahaemolyticus]EGQ9287047.1 N-6 DNA methylase [Vibrio parahaemolyticus]EID4379816.1 N-6 DNA methylase [Vibrio parahaemolyticus]
MNNNDLVAKLWKLCDNLRDGGVSYQNYVNELASLLFLKMCEETEQEDELLPEGYRWANLKSKIGQEQHQFYRNMLVQLGADDHAIVRAIFQNVNTTITQPAQLTELVDNMDNLEWFDGSHGKSRDDFGDMYEGLLQKNANETKSGAGQYFTPRALISTIVKVMQPQPREIVQDPAAGTAGFLIEADKYIKAQTNDLDDLELDDQEFQRTRAFVGLELVPETRRLALMNCLLHDIDGDVNEGAIRLGNTLGSAGESLPKANVIMTNPPFGSAASTNITRTFVHPTGNKQLCFMQHIYDALEPGGRAAVVVPDNVLFEGGKGTEIRKDLMDKCNLHTILRLPTGIFYAQGVKTNVLFFQKGSPENKHQDKGCTKETWVFDMRTNMNTFGKRRPLTEKHFDAFITAYGADKNGQSPREEGVYETLGNIFAEGETAESVSEKAHKVDSARWRKFSREYIRDQKGDSLDISWLKDLEATSAENLPEPEVLAGEAMAELTEAMSDIYQLMQALGANDEAEAQKQLLEEAFGLSEKPEAE